MAVIRAYDAFVDFVICIGSFAGSAPGQSNVAACFGDGQRNSGESLPGVSPAGVAKPKSRSCEEAGQPGSTE